MVSTTLVVNSSGKCSKCSSLQEDYYLQKNALPVWYDDLGEPQYHVPSVLTNLTVAEKLLIQRASPFIPLRYIKNGVFGLSGHVCTFEQDVEEFINVLPRHRDDTTMLTVLKTISTEIGNDDCAKEQAFRVRKEAVSSALLWLKKYNKEYMDIEINLESMNWMKGHEDTMDGLLLPTVNDLQTEKDSMFDSTVDLGPNPETTRHNLLSGDQVKEFGYLDEGEGIVTSKEDEEIKMKLQETIRNCPKERSIHVTWPSGAPIPINEYGTTKIFARAYPWLFPGGIGDVKDHPSTSVGDWGKQMLYYQDGRFSKDKFFSFFAMNYIAKNRNASSGN